MAILESKLCKMNVNNKIENDSDHEYCTVPFASPTTMGIFGATLCGKSTWCRKMIEQSANLFTEPIIKILYCYGMYQDVFHEMETEIDNLYLHAGLPNRETKNDFASNKDHTMIVLDDLQQEMSKEPQIEKLFTQLAHHLNITVVFMGNNIFYKNFSRTITVNLHVMVLFRNARDVQQIRCLARQLYPLKSDKFMTVYEDSTGKPYGYLVVDLSPSSCEQLRLRTNIFEKENPVIYKI